MSNPGKWKAATADDEVDQLLRAAQDDVLLNLNLSSHIARASASVPPAIDPDLDRRFQALRNPTKVHDSTKPGPPKSDTCANFSVGEVGVEDDLFARFSALKNSLPAHKGGNQNGDVLVNQEVKEEESEDEVEKVIQWAIDAARLDPSPSSDDDEDDTDADADADADDHDDGKKKKVTKK